MSDNSYLPGEVKVKDSFESDKTVSFAAYELTRGSTRIEL